MPPPSRSIAIWRSRIATPRSRPRRGARPMKILVTGAAGFIGMHLALRLKRDGFDVAGIDNFSPYYDVALKRARMQELAGADLRCEELDLADAAATLAHVRDGGFS